MMRVWLLPLLLVGTGALVAASMALRGSVGSAALFLLGFVVLAGLNSPLVFPRPTGAAADGRPVVYWRPGCKYCLRLRLRLGRDARRAHWVNIWRDPEGAAMVRAANDGNETVPTVVVAGRPYTNPDPAWVRERLLATSRPPTAAG
ncbi:glutaredoxin domain-containing protein [Streptomyces sp. NPDC101160]|uniref:glutaredoxin domain-containing protein n=1 Tax=Streptomyces sp. NPDC101160 TaxID=3366118 RepID=UPI0037F9B66F